MDLTEVKYYKVIEAETSEELQRMVNNSIEAGFVPIGGISVSITSYTYESVQTGYSENCGSSTYAQAMVDRSFNNTST